MTDRYLTMVLEEAKQVAEQHDHWRVAISHTVVAMFVVQAFCPGGGPTLPWAGYVYQETAVLPTAL